MRLWFQHQSGLRCSQQLSEKQLLEPDLWGGGRGRRSAEPHRGEWNKAHGRTSPDQVKVCLFMWGQFRHDQIEHLSPSEHPGEIHRTENPGQQGWQQSRGLRHASLTGGGCAGMQRLGGLGSALHHFWHFSRGDRTVYRKPFVTGAGLSSPRPQQRPFPTPPFIRSLSAAQRGSQEVHPGWNSKPEILRRCGWGKRCHHQF